MYCTSCAVKLLYNAALNSRHLCSYLTNSFFFHICSGFLFEELTFQMLSPSTLFCHNFFKALALQKSRGVCRTSSQPPTPQPLLPILYYCLTTSSQTPPTPSQLICHLHSSPQDNSNEPKDPMSKVWDNSTYFISSSLLSDRRVKHEDRCRSAIPVP